MAIDNAEKRKSASQTLTGLSGPGVTPNASPDAEWRQQAGWGYSGIAASGAPTGAVQNMIKGANLGADLYNGILQ